MINMANSVGYLLICLSEPLLLLSYLLRFLRIKRIFDAKQIYVDKGVRPTEMIKSYSENRLCIIAVSLVALFTVLYMIAGVSTWMKDENWYGLLPTFAFSSSHSNI